MTSVLIKERQEKETQRGEAGNETGVMCPQAKERLEPTEAGRGEASLLP